MALIAIFGRVKKSGTNDHGAWFVLEETNYKRDGEEYTKTYMCNSKTAPTEGSYGLVSGYAYAAVREHDGNHYADIKVSGATFTAAKQEHAPSHAPAAPADDDEIPFVVLPRERRNASRDGHQRYDSWVA